jgi:heavy metal translocating P-type ATPase
MIKLIIYTLSHWLKTVMTIQTLINHTVLAVMSVIMIILHLLPIWSGEQVTYNANWPLYIALCWGGLPLVGELLLKIVKGEFGADLLAGISIITSVLLGEYLAGTLVVLMLSGGEAIEAYAIRQASSVLEALSKRMPSLAHAKSPQGVIDIPLLEVKIGDTLLVFPHEICPVDGVVIEGNGVMDESFLTGEPEFIMKTPGSPVISGAINGDYAILIKAEKLALDSRYAKIMQVMEQSAQNKPQIRRLADQLGAWYTPLAVLLGLLAWYISGESKRFLAVIVVATPCPLLIAIPVAIIGAISLCAKRSIIIRDPSALELADTCQTLIFDKTGTLTYGHPHLTEQHVIPSINSADLLLWTSSIERYSRHPLSKAIIDASNLAGLTTAHVSEISEKPGAGLTGKIDNRLVQVTSRKKILNLHPEWSTLLPADSGGLECVILVDQNYAGTYKFRDVVRSDGKSFISHLGSKHAVKKTMIVSGDRETEVRYLADQVGITEIYASQTPEQKLEIVKRETQTGVGTIYIGDGINDAPALMTANIGIAYGQQNDVTVEAADVVVLDSQLKRVDEFLHISRRMRNIALQSALGGMALSIVGMVFAMLGYLSPVMGAIFQEVIDLFAVLNALRVIMPTAELYDFDQSEH